VLLPHSPLYGFSPHVFGSTCLNITSHLIKINSLLSLSNVSFRDIIALKKGNKQCFRFILSSMLFLLSFSLSLSIFYLFLLTRTYAVTSPPFSIFFHHHQMTLPILGMFLQQLFKYTNVIYNLMFVHNGIKINCILDKNLEARKNV